MENSLIKNLKYISCETRKRIFRILKEAKSGHPGASLSSVELLVTLYFGGILHYDPKNPNHPNRDRVLIRGYVGPTRYSILAMAGFFSEDRLLTYRKLGDRLPGLPGMEDFHLVKGVDITPSGSVGMLLSYAAGAALFAKKSNKSFKVYAFLGNTEEQEGNISEAARNISHLGLDNVVCIISDDGKGLSGKTLDVEKNIDLKKIWEGYGWHVLTLDDGHNIRKILNTYNKAYCKGKPVVIIAKTIKGRGIPGIEAHPTGTHSYTELENWKKGRRKKISLDELIKYSGKRTKEIGQSGLP